MAPLYHRDGPDPLPAQRQVVPPPDVPDPANATADPADVVSLSDCLRCEMTSDERRLLERLWERYDLPPVGPEMTVGQCATGGRLAQSVIGAFNRGWGV